MEGVGLIRLPVKPAQAKKLCAVARPAKFGHRDETILDPAVRDAWEIFADLVSLDAPGLDAARLGELIARPVRTEDDWVGHLARHLRLRPVHDVRRVPLRRFRRTLEWPLARGTPQAHHAVCPRGEYAVRHRLGPLHADPEQDRRALRTRAEDEAAGHHRPGMALRELASDRLSVRSVMVGALGPALTSLRCALPRGRASPGLSASSVKKEAGPYDGRLA